MKKSILTALFILPAMLVSFAQEPRLSGWAFRRITGGMKLCMAWHMQAMQRFSPRRPGWPQVLITLKNGIR